MNWGETLKKRWQVIVAIVAALAVVIGISVALSSGQSQQASGDTSATPDATASASAEPSISVIPSAERDPASIADCQPLGEGFEPVRFTLEQPAADEAVLSLGEDEEGNIAAPPGDMPRTASWWNNGPKAGSEKGKVVLSIHTYRRGGALGNELYADEQPLIEVGDLIKLYGAEGQVACYEFKEHMKVWVEEYDENSDIMIDYEGSPRLLIIICSDQVAGQPAASRIFFYFDPVVAS